MSHDDDIGQDMRERELYASETHEGNQVRTNDEPDNQALVGALLAQCGYCVDDLAQVDNVATLCDAPRETLAHSLHDLDHQLQLLLEVRDSVAQSLAALMESDLESIAGLAVTRGRTDKTEWDRAGARSAVRHALIDRWARQGDDVDKVKVDVIERVMVDMAQVYPSANPTVAGLNGVGVNANEYRAVTRGTRFTVKVQ